MYRDCTRSNKTRKALRCSGLRVAPEVGVDDSAASAEGEDGSDHREDDAEMSAPARAIPCVEESGGSSPTANVQWERTKALPPSMEAMQTPPPVPPKPWLKSKGTGPGRAVPHMSSSHYQNYPTTGKTLDHDLDVEDPGKGALLSTTPPNKQMTPELCQVIGQCLSFNHGLNNDPGKHCLTVAGSGSSPKAGQRLSPSLLRPSPPPKPQKRFTAPEAGGEEGRKKGEEEEVAINEMSNLSKAMSSGASQEEEDPGGGKGKEKKQEEEAEDETHFKVISVIAENSSQLGERATLGSVPCAPLGQEAGRPGGAPTGSKVAPFPKPPRRKQQVTLLHTEIQTPQPKFLDSERRDRVSPDSEAHRPTEDAPVFPIRQLEEPQEVQNVRMESFAEVLLPVPCGFEDPLDGATDQGPMLKMVDRLEDGKEHERQTGGHREEEGGERQEGGEMALALRQDLPRPIRMQMREEGGGMDQEEGENRGKVEEVEGRSEPSHTNGRVEWLNGISQSSVSSLECCSPVNPVEELLSSGEERSPFTSIKRSSWSPARNHPHPDGVIFSEPVGETDRTLAQDVFDCNHDDTEDQSIYEDVYLPSSPQAAFPGNQTADGSEVPTTFLSSNEGHMSPRTFDIYETVKLCVNPLLLADISAVKFVGPALDFSVQKYRIGLSRKRKHRPPWRRNIRQDPSSLASTALQVFPASIFYKVPDTDGQAAVTSQGQQKVAGTSPKPLVIMTALRDKTKMKAAQPKDKGKNRYSALI